MKYSTVTVLENCNIWSQHVAFWFQWSGALFNLSKPEGGIREHLFRTVVQSSRWAPENYNSIVATTYCLLSVQETPVVESAIKQRSIQRVVVAYFGLYSLWCHASLFLSKIFLLGWGIWHGLYERSVLLQKGRWKLGENIKWLWTLMFIQQNRVHKALLTAPNAYLVRNYDLAIVLELHHSFGHGALCCGQALSSW